MRTSIIITVYLSKKNFYEIFDLCTMRSKIFYKKRIPERQFQGDVTASKTEIVVAVVIQLKIFDTMYKKIFQWIQQRLKLKYIIRSYLM